MTTDKKALVEGQMPATAETVFARHERYRADEAFYLLAIGLLETIRCPIRRHSAAVHHELLDHIGRAVTLYSKRAAESRLEANKLYEICRRIQASEDELFNVKRTRLGIFPIVGTAAVVPTIRPICWLCREDIRNPHACNRCGHVVCEQCIPTGGRCSTFGCGTDMAVRKWIRVYGLNE